MIELKTPLGQFWLRSSEVIAITHERNRPGCSIVYTQLFPDGISVDMTPLEIIELIWDEEAEYDVEFTAEEDEEEEESESKTQH